MKASPEEVFVCNFTITTSGVNDSKVLAYVINALGVDKVMWAIDYPYETSKPAVEFLDQAPVTPSNREALPDERGTGFPPGGAKRPGGPTRNLQLREELARGPPHLDSRPVH